MPLTPFSTPVTNEQVTAAVSSALAGFNQVNVYSDDFVPLLGFDTGGVFSGTTLGSYTVVDDQVFWYVRYSGAVDTTGASGAFYIDLSGIGSTPDTYKANAKLAFYSGINKNTTSNGLDAYQSYGSSLIRLQQSFSSTQGNQNLTTANFSASVTLNLSGFFTAT